MAGYGLTALLVTIALTIVRVARCESSADTSSAADGVETWRDAPHDDVNTLYLFLRCWGHGATHAQTEEALRKRGPHASFVDLRNVAHQFSLRSSVFQCPPGKLGQGALPAVVMMDFVPERGGAFALVVNYNGESWQLIDGATATVQDISDDEFRRRWSGFVLLAEVDHSVFRQFSLIVGIGIFLVYVAWRFRGFKVGPFARLLLCSLALAPRPACAQLSEAVQAALERNAAILNRISVSWEETRHSKLPLEELGKEIVSADLSILEPSQFRVVRDGEKSYGFCTFSNQVGQRLEANRSETAYDGAQLYIGTTEDRSLTEPVLYIVNLQEQSQRMRNAPIIETNYFEQAGYEVPRTAAHAKEPPRSKVLADIALGYHLSEEREADWNGVRCRRLSFELPHDAAAIALVWGEKTLLRGPTNWPRHEYYLDPARNYALIAWQQRGRQGELAATVENEDFIQLSDTTGASVWLPRSSRVAWHTWHTIPGRCFAEPLLFTELVVHELHNSPVSARQFVLDYRTPGSTIGRAETIASDNQTSEETTYLVPAEQKDLDAVIQTVMQGAERPVSSLSRFSPLVTYVAVAMFSALVVFLGSHWIRRQHERAG
jgi:hypothetical protein